MNGEITADDLRAAIVHYTSLDHGKRLHVDIVDQAWRESEIQQDLGKTSGTRTRATIPTEGWQYSVTITRFGVITGMGYWFDRNDSTWNVARVGLPSAAVVIYQQDDPLPAKIQRPSKAWRKGLGEDDPMGKSALWVRTLDKTPRYDLRIVVVRALSQVLPGRIQRTQGCAALWLKSHRGHCRRGVSSSATQRQLAIVDRSSRSREGLPDALDVRVRILRPDPCLRHPLRDGTHDRSHRNAQTPDTRHSSARTARAAPRAQQRLEGAAS